MASTPRTRRAKAAVEAAVASPRAPSRTTAPADGTTPAVAAAEAAARGGWAARLARAVVYLVVLWITVGAVWIQIVARGTTYPETMPVAFDATLRGDRITTATVGEAVSALKPAPAGADTSAPAVYDFGRWRRPLRDLTFLHDEHASVPDRLRRFTTLKHWAYISFNSDRFFVAFALVQFNYVSDVFVYLVDKAADPSAKWEYTGRRPFGLGVDFAPSSIVGCSTWSSSLAHPEAHDISMCFNEAELSWKVDINVALTALNGTVEPLALTLKVGLDDALALLFPLENGAWRPAYTHKSAGMHAAGVAVWQGAEHDLTGLASIDWTKSLASRETRWRWASFNGYAHVTIARVKHSTVDGKTVEEVSEVVADDANTPIGINLSSDVYDWNGHSQENGIWVNGTVFLLAGVTFAVPLEPLKAPWKISSRTGPAQEVVHLQFTPLGSREDHTHVLSLLVSDFVQPFGYMNGTIEFRPEGSGLLYRVIVPKLFGVVEDHVAVW